MRRRRKRFQESFIESFLSVVLGFVGIGIGITFVICVGAALIRIVAWVAK